MNDLVAKLNNEWQNLTPVEVLSQAVELFGSGLTLASSLGSEDQVLSHMLNKVSDIGDVFVLDTGRLNNETYDVLSNSQKEFSLNYRIFYPESQAIESYVMTHGVNAFYDDVALRKLCCEIRKVKPLQRALSGYKAWITGIRRAQSVTRMSAELVEWDDAYQMIKVNPLVMWSKKQVWTYIKDHKVPYNALHDLGFASIGCAPCTRAIEAGEDERAGRWWWESPEHKECGLHVKGSS